jgi:hypothetical protein
VSRASKAERARRLNAAIGALRAHGAAAPAAAALAAQYGLSVRQAYRYVEEAGRLEGELPVPTPTLAFTVKLPTGLIRALRTYAGRTQRTLSEVVAEALRRLLAEDRGRG